METTTNICGICGNSGYMEFIVTCNCCKRASGHTYCMQADPLVVPDVWYCEKCLQEAHLVQGKMPDICTENNSKSYHYDLKENLSQTKGSPRLNNDTASEEINDGRKKQKLKHAMHSSSSNAFRKVIENAKVKFIPPEEVALTIRGTTCCKSANSCASRHQSGAANVIYPVNSRKASTNMSRTHSLATIGVLNKPTKSIVSVDSSLSTGKVIMSREEATDVKERRMQKNKASASDTCLNASRLHNDGGTTDRSKLKYFGETSNTRSEEKRKATSIVADESHPLQEHNQRKATKFIGVGVEHTRDEKVRTSETLGGFEYCAALCNRSASKENVPSLTLLINPNENFLNFPAPEPCWRGDFVVFDMVNHVHNEIQAHFPSRISHKAYEISKMLPEKLKLDMVPRKNSWSKKFQSDPPTYEDIGLYFFPSQFERQKEKYFRLLKRIDSRDFSLKAWIGDVELLIYSSKQLRVDCHQIDGQSYLWGIFWHLKHRKKHRRRQDIIYSTATTQLKSNTCDQLIVDSEGCDQEVTATTQLKSNTCDQLIVDSEGCDQEVDMEIDMIGGEEIGQPEKPIRKRDAPPGFPLQRAFSHDALPLCKPVVRFSLKKRRPTLSNVHLGFSTTSNTKLTSVSPIAGEIQVALAIHDRPLGSKTSSTHSDVVPGFYSTSNTKLASVSPIVDKIQPVPEIHDNALDSKSNSSYSDVPPGFSRTSNKKLASVSPIDKLPSLSEVHDSPLNSKTSSSQYIVPHGLYRASNTKLANVPPIVDKIQSAPEIHNSPLNSKTSSLHSHVPSGFSRTSNTKLASASPIVDRIQSLPEIHDRALNSKTTSTDSDVPHGFSTSNTKIASVSPNADKIPSASEIHDKLLNSKTSSTQFDVPFEFSRTLITKVGGALPIPEKIQSAPEIHDSPLNSKTSSVHSDLPLGYSMTSNTELACVSPIVDNIQLDPKICDSLLCRKISSIHADAPPGFSRTSNRKQASVPPNADKTQLAPEIHDSPIRKSRSRKLAAILPLFPQEAESIKVKEISDGDTRQMISVDLSLSRPDYLMDGNVCISATPRVSFDRDDCEEDLHLKL